MKNYFAVITLVGASMFSSHASAMSDTEKAVSYAVCSNLHETLQYNAPTSDQADMHRKYSSMAFSKTVELVGHAKSIMILANDKVMAAKLFAMNRKAVFNSHLLEKYCPKDFDYKFTPDDYKSVSETPVADSKPIVKDTRENLRPLADMSTGEILKAFDAGRFTPIKLMMCSELTPREMSVEYDNKVLPTFDPKDEFENSSDLLNQAWNYHSVDKLLSYLISQDKNTFWFIKRYCD